MRRHTHTTTTQNTATRRRLALCALTLLTGFATLAMGCSGKASSPNGPGGGPTPLSVSGITPVAGATNVNVGIAVTATFSRDLDPATVTTSSFFITGVPGSVSTAGSAATFTPDVPLSEGTDYAVVITTAVKDQSSVGLASEFNATFTTGIVAAANAGPDKDASIGETVALVGSTSAPGGATFQWAQVAGPSVGSLSGTTAVFTAPDSVSTLVFTLRVDNGSGWSAPDSVVVWVLEDRAHTFWVSPNGSDDSAGTRTAPLLTIQRAIDLAHAALQGGDVYIAEGVYAGSITLAANVSLYGGYYSENWMREVTTHVTSIQGGTVAVSGAAAHNVVLDGLHIQAADATGPGASSIGVSFTASQNVRLMRSRIAAGNGAAGNNGVQPSQPAKQSKGGAGDGAGDCIPANEGGSGVGSTSRRGGNGGNGGAAGGFDGGGGVGPCGAGGNGGFADAGDPGENGCTGAVGDSATTGGAPFGAIANGLYTPASGPTGGHGVEGGGGGGGGGGAGSVVGCGAGGGGGGEGGVGGSGGPGGQGGGASLGIVLATNTSATVVENVITTASGGNGGHGANGGAGGGGGPSVGIAEQGSTSVQDRLTFVLGTPGTGGVRPDGRGTPGQNGEQAEVKKLP